MGTVEQKQRRRCGTAACKAKGSVVLFDQPEVGPPCGHICAVFAASGNNTSGMCTAGDESAADAAGKGVSSDDGDALVDVPLTVGKKCQGRPQKPCPAKAK